MVRGSGKFKTKRGGGRNFSRNLAPLGADGEPISVPDKWAPRGAVDEEDEDEESEESESEEEDADGVKPQPGPLAAASPDAPELTRAERRAQKKGKAPGKGHKAGDEDESESDDEDLVNLNRAVQKNTKLSNVGAAPAQLSRREREEKEKKEAKERYWKLHVQGKTDQAKADLARLAAIKKEREMAAAQRKAETEAKDAELKAKTAASKQKRGV